MDEQIGGIVNERPLTPTLSHQGRGSLGRAPRQGFSWIPAQGRDDGSDLGQNDESKFEKDSNTQEAIRWDR